jgi:AcrR family transcriptional regulator
MRRADRYQQLMKIARQLVAQEGGDALTMTALSELAGVAKPVVYSHFGNSSEVIIELLDTHFEQLTRSVAEKISDAETLDDYVSRLVDASFDFENASDLPIRKITNGFSADPLVNEAYLRHEDEFVSHWAQLLLACGANRNEVELSAYAISSMVSNTVYTYALKPRQKNARETMKKLLLCLIEAVATDARVKFKPKMLKLNAASSSEPQPPSTTARARARTKA